MTSFMSSQPHETPTLFTITVCRVVNNKKDKQKILSKMSSTDTITIVNGSRDEVVESIVREHVGKQYRGWRLMEYASH